MTYRINKWDELFENNRTRELKNMGWVPVPNRHDGDGYTTLVDRKNGAALLGAWLVILQVASKCDPRGTLLREGGKPHDAASIARMTRLPASIIQEAIDVCLTETHWLECDGVTQIPQEGAVKPQEGAAIPHPTDYGTEGKGREQNGMERTGTPSLDAVSVLGVLNAETGKAFRAVDSNLKLIQSRLEEPGVDVAGVIQMVKRQVAKWKRDPQMSDYLRPETLFNKTKFESYYAARNEPVSQSGASRPTPADQRNARIIGADEVRERERRAAADDAAGLTKMPYEPDYVSPRAQRQATARVDQAG